MRALKSLALGIVCALVLASPAAAVRRANVQWWLSPSVVAVPTGTATNYVACQGADTGGFATTHRAAANVLAARTTFTQLGVRISADIGGAGPALTATLEINGADTALTCTITGAGGTESTCTDSTHRVTASAGDLCAIKVATTATITSGAIPTFSLKTIQARRRIQVLQHMPIATSGSNRFDPFMGNALSAQTAETLCLQAAPIAGTLRAVRCLTLDSSGNPIGPDNGAGTQSWTMTPRAGGAAISGADCVISEAATSCSVTGLSAAIGAGDVLSFQIAFANTPITGVEAICTTLIDLDRNNATWLLHTNNGAITSAGGTVYASGVGAGTHNASGDAVKLYAPAAGTLSNLRAVSSVDPTPGTWTTTQWAGATLAATTLTCAINTGSTSCSDTTHSVSVSAGDEMAVQAAPSSTPASIRLGKGVLYTVP